MYAVVSNPWLLEDKNSTVYQKDDLKRILDFFPMPADISGSIEELLVYSPRKEDADKEAMICKPALIKHENDQLTITVRAKEPSGISSGQISRAVYGYWMRSGKIKEGTKLPYVTLIEDYAEYNRIKTGSDRRRPMNLSWSAKAEEYKQKNQWENIVKMVPDWNTIEKHDVWNSSDGLGELAFALSQINHRLYSDKKSNNQKIKDNDERFQKVINRALTIDPENTKLLSVEAYRYYDRYLSLRKLEDYRLGSEKLKALTGSFTNAYRYAKLLQEYAESYRENVNGQDEAAVKPAKWDEIRECFEDLIENKYQALSDNDKTKNKTQYIRCLYNDAAVIIDHMSPDWETYFSFKTGRCVKKYRLQLLKTAEERLDIALQLVPQNVTKEAANTKPNTLDILYRKAQVYQAQGVAYLLKNKDGQKYFEKSVREAESAIRWGKAIKDAGISMKGFGYVYTCLTLSRYLLGQSIKSLGINIDHGRYQGWQWYKLAQLLYLDGSMQQAVQCLERISEKDLCRKKADALKKRIKEIQDAEI